MTGRYSVPSNPSVKWAPTGVAHTNFAGRIENFMFDRMDPLAGRELCKRRYGQPESVQGPQGIDDDSAIASASTSPTAAAAGPTVLADGTLAVPNIADYSPVKIPGESKPVYVYVGDLPPRIPIDERNIPPLLPPLRKAVPYNPDREVRRMISVPPGFEAQFAVQARELNLAEGEASSSAEPFGGQQKIDWKGKGKMIAQASPSATAAYGQKIDWKGKGKEIIFPEESLSSGSGSSLEMVELKAGPPPKLPDDHVETYTYVSVSISAVVD